MVDALAFFGIAFVLIAIIVGILVMLSKSVKEVPGETRVAPVKVAAKPARRVHKKPTAPAPPVPEEPQGVPGEVHTDLEDLLAKPDDKLGQVIGERMDEFEVGGELPEAEEGNIEELLGSGEEETIDAFHLKEVDEELDEAMPEPGLGAPPAPEGGELGAPPAPKGDGLGTPPAPVKKGADAPKAVALDAPPAPVKKEEVPGIMCMHMLDNGKGHKEIIGALVDAGMKRYAAGKKVRTWSEKWERHRKPLLAQLAELDSVSKQVQYKYLKRQLDEPTMKRMIRDNELQKMQAETKLRATEGLFKK